MNCPKCNTEIPENGICPVCAAANAQPKPEVIKKKSEFVAKYGSEKAKKTAFITRILGCALALLFVIGAIITTNTSLDKIPMFSSLIDVDDIEDLIAIGDIDDLEDDLDDFLDEYEDDVTKKQEKELRDYVKTAKKCLKTFSINNIKKLYNETKDIAKTVALITDTDEDDMLESFDNDDTKITMAIFNAISAASWFFAILLAVLAFFAGQKLSSGWAIATIIVSVLPELVLVGFFHFLLTTAGLITIVVFSKQLKAEQKAFYTGVAL